MDLKKYNKLRERISKKDFEGKNKTLDRWLYFATFFANGVSIFFAFFLLYPALKSSFLMNIGNYNVANVSAILFSVGFLLIFEVVKRFLIRNFSFDYIWRKFDNIITKTTLWFSLVILIIGISFYLSMSGAKNFADTFRYEREGEIINMTAKVDSIRAVYQKIIDPYEENNKTLTEINLNYRIRMGELPDDYLTGRREFQNFILQNEETIRENREVITNYRFQMLEDIAKIEEGHQINLEEKREGSYNIIFLFFIIVLLNESIIVLGLYFREYYEYKLYVLNSRQYENFYEKKKYYKKMLKYIYSGGMVEPGDVVGGFSSLENELMKKTKIENPIFFVAEFIDFLKRNSIVTQGRKPRDPFRYIKSYNEALKILDTLNENVLEINDTDEE